MIGEEKWWLVQQYHQGGRWWGKLISPKGEVYTSRRKNTSAQVVAFVQDFTKACTKCEYVPNEAGSCIFKGHLDYFVLDKLCEKYDFRLSYQLRGGQWEPIISWEVNYATGERVLKDREPECESEGMLTP